ncbi:hypothetical protein [Pontibacter roseus]|uniref:hypothetical protein n=1 Tax=Pontibacter roseus TaxID=336989 RepID=UPI0003602AC9|nr:hypothetical protein [Pontibacter roseus]
MREVKRAAQGGKDESHTSRGAAAWVFFRVSLSFFWLKVMTRLYGATVARLCGLTGVLLHYIKYFGGMAIPGVC